MRSSRESAFLREMLGMKESDIHTAEVVRHSGALMVPETMDLEDAAMLLLRKHEEEESITTFTAEVSTSPFDGAIALSVALEKIFGFAIAAKPKNFFDSGPTILEIPVDAQGGTIRVPWGKFEVPGADDGTVSTSYSMKGGRIIFCVKAEFKRKFERKFHELVTLVKELVATSSIYRGKAFNVAFTDRYGHSIEMPEFEFMDLTQATRPIFSRDLDESFEYDVLTWIKQPELIRQMNGTLKRGVLLTGPYGTGKTMSAGYIASLAVAQGFTFIYVEPQDIPTAIDFAKLYQPAVIFAEDVEKVAQVDRGQEVDKLLNKLDGVDSKRDDIISIFTTNHVENITPALLRPGRIDVKLDVLPPDADASVRIVRLVAGSAAAADESYEEAGQVLAGNIPAVIAEAVKRAKIRANVREGHPDAVISNSDLVTAARLVVRSRQVETVKHLTDRESAANILGEAIVKAAVSAQANDMPTQASNKLVGQNGHAILEAVAD